MRTLLFLGAAAMVLAAAGSDEGITSEILGLERKALDGWQVGNPDPGLAICDPDVTYFHVTSGNRVDGLPALKELFEPYRGRPLFDSYELSGPKVQVNGDVAVLTYILVRHLSGDTTRWNATRVYQRKKDGWRVIHMHWSQNTRPQA